MGPKWPAVLGIWLGMACLLQGTARAGMPMLPDLIQGIKPSVVAVGTYYFNDVPKAAYLGTGFAVGSGRLIMTSFHVVKPLVREEKQSRLRIFHRDLPSKGVKAKLAAWDEFHDLALLEHGGSPLSPLGLEKDEPAVREGVEVAFTGYPIGFVLGLNPTTHRGIVSSIAPLVKPSPSARIMDGRTIRHLDDPYEVFQIDAVAYPGNSGSPVFKTSDGRVIGVINQVFVRGRKEHVLREPSGITYAIPIGFALDLMKRKPRKP